MRSQFKIPNLKDIGNLSTDVPEDGVDDPFFSLWRKRDGAGTKTHVTAVTAEPISTFHSQATRNAHIDFKSHRSMVN